MATVSPIQILIRAPANRSFVQGYPGIPGDESAARPAAVASGTVEFRVPKPIKVSRLKITLLKTERLPQQAGGTSFADVVAGPLTLWEAQGEYAPLGSRDFDFELPLPLKVASSVDLLFDKSHRPGISYTLEVTVQEKDRSKGIKGLLKGKAPPANQLFTEDVEILSHTTHPSWPVYNIPETVEVANPMMKVVLRRPSTAYAPGTAINLPLTLLPSLSLPGPLPIFCVQLTLLERTTFRSGEVESSTSGPAGGTTYKISGQRPSVVSQSRLETRGEPLFPGPRGAKTWGLVLRVPPGEAMAYTVQQGSHIQVAYELKLEIIGGQRGTDVLTVIDKIPVVIGWAAAEASQALVRKIGYVFDLCPGGPPPSNPSAPSSINDHSSHTSHSLHNATPSLSPYPATPIDPRARIISGASSSVPTTEDAPGYSSIGNYPSPRSSVTGHGGGVPNSPGSFESSGGGGHLISSAGGVGGAPGGTPSPRPRPTMAGEMPSSLASSDGHHPPPPATARPRMSFVLRNPSPTRDDDDETQTQTPRTTGGRGGGGSTSLGFGGGGFAGSPDTPVARESSSGLVSPPAAQARSSTSALNTATAPPLQSPYPTAAEEKARLFGKARAALDRPSQSPSSEQQPAASSSSSSAAPAPVPAPAPAPTSSVASNPPKWESAADEKKRLFDMAQYQVARTQAIAAGQPMPPLPESLRPRLKATQPQQEAAPTSAAPPSFHEVTASSSSSSAAAASQSQQQPSYESAEAEKARLARQQRIYAEANARVAQTQARSASASGGGRAAGSPSGANDYGTSSTMEPPPAAAAAASGSSSTSSSSAAAPDRALARAPAAYETAAEEKARLAKQQRLFNEATARVAQTQARAASISGSGSGSGYNNNEDSPPPAHEDAPPPAGAGSSSGASASASAPPPFESAAAEKARLAKQQRLFNEAQQVIANKQRSGTSEIGEGLPFSSSSAAATESSSFGAVPRSASQSLAAASPSADEDSKARLEYQDAVAARERAFGGGSSSSSSSGGGGGLAAAPSSAEATFPPPPPAAAGQEHASMPYDQPFGGSSGASGNGNGGGSGFGGGSSLAAAASSSSSRPKPTPPAGPPSATDEKEQMRRFYAAKEAVARFNAPPTAASPSSASTITPTSVFPSPAAGAGSEFAASRHQQAMNNSLSGGLTSVDSRTGSPASFSSSSRQVHREPSMMAGKQRGPPVADSNKGGHFPLKMASSSTAQQTYTPSSPSTTKHPSVPPPLPERPPAEYASRYASFGTTGGSPVAPPPAPKGGGGGDSGSGSAWLS